MTSKIECKDRNKSGLNSDIIYLNGDVKGDTIASNRCVSWRNAIVMSRVHIYDWLIIASNPV